MKVNPAGTYRASSTQLQLLGHEVYSLVTAAFGHHGYSFIKAALGSVKVPTFGLSITFIERQLMSPPVNFSEQAR